MTKQTNPFFNFDATQMMANFDPAQVADKFKEFAGDYKVPKMDMDSILTVQRKNMEALTETNKALFDGVQKVSNNQAKVFQDSFDEMTKAFSSFGTLGKPTDNTAKQAEFYQDAVEKTLSNMSELVDMVTNTDFNPFTALEKTITENPTVKPVVKTAPASKKTAPAKPETKVAAKTKKPVKAQPKPAAEKPAVIKPVAKVASAKPEAKVVAAPAKSAPKATAKLASVKAKPVSASPKETAPQLDLKATSSEKKTIVENTKITVAKLGIDEPVTTKKPARKPAAVAKKNKVTAMKPAK